MNNLPINLDTWAIVGALVIGGCLGALIMWAIAT